MTRIAGFFAMAIVGLVVLSATGPTLVVLAHALVPLVIVAGTIALVLRAVWFFTNRW